MLLMLYSNIRICESFLPLNSIPVMSRTMVETNNKRLYNNNPIKGMHNILFYSNRNPFQCYPKRTPRFSVHCMSKDKNINDDDNTNTYGIGMDQNDMMEKDMLIAVNENDVIIPNAQISKKKAHQFNRIQPRGIAHRAFSVFLFNAKKEMLLTRRAMSKITFPGVWTNTCCSHPLHGQSPNEVDDVKDAYPHFPGIKHAAIRKLNHELGIEAKDVPHDDFRFLTRFHYWAADTVTYGNDSPWGEHEIDYVLFIQCDEDPTVCPNEEEVDEYKYVSLEELKNMMYKDDDLLWSPWFKGIMERGGFEFWEHLDEALEVDSNWINRDIVFFDPPIEHCAEYNLPDHGKETGVLVLDR